MYLDFTIIGEFFLPWVLRRYYEEYDSKTMVMSALGNPESPVHVIYNLWLIWLGGFLVFVAIAYFYATRTDFPILSVLLLVSIGAFAVGAGLISGIFHVNESKDVVTEASKIHGISVAIGFMAFLFSKYPIFLGRNRLVVGQLLQQDFVRLGIRYIAIMDNIDTKEGLSDFLPVQVDGKTVYPIDIYHSGIGIISAPCAEQYEDMFQKRLKQKHSDKEKRHSH